VAVVPGRTAGRRRTGAGRKASFRLRRVPGRGPLPAQAGLGDRADAARRGTELDADAPADRAGGAAASGGAAAGGPRKLYAARVAGRGGDGPGGWPGAVRSTWG